MCRKEKYENIEMFSYFFASQGVFTSELDDTFIPHRGSLVAHEVDHGSGYVGKTEGAVVLLDGVGILVEVVVNDAGNRV